MPLKTMNLKTIEPLSIKKMANLLTACCQKRLEYKLEAYYKDMRPHYPIYADNNFKVLCSECNKFIVGGKINFNKYDLRKIYNPIDQNLWNFFQYTIEEADWPIRSHLQIYCRDINGILLIAFDLSYRHFHPAKHKNVLRIGGKDEV